MKLHHIRHFHAIANSGSLRSAARALGLAQPALTRSLRELELELGLPLVERHPHGVTLTVAGERFHLRATNMLEDLQRARDEANQLRGELQGTVSVGLSPVVQGTLLQPVYKKFRLKFPQVRLRILEAVYPMAVAGLNDASLDFYAGPSPEVHPGPRFQIDPLWQKDRAVIARKGHPLANATTLAELCNAEWLSFGLRSRVEDEFDEVFQTHGLISPRLNTLVSSVLTLLMLLSSTDALVFLPRELLMADLFKDTIALPVKEKIPGPAIVQIRRTGVPLTPAAEELFQLISKAANNKIPMFD